MNAISDETKAHSGDGRRKTVTDDHNDREGNAVVTGAIIRGAVGLLLVGLTAAHSLALADEVYPGRGWLRGGAEGWWWYQDPAPPAVVEPSLPAPPPPAPQAVVAERTPPPPTASPEATPAVTPEPPVFSAAWFKQKLDGYRDAAIDDPTPANVHRYLYLQHVMMDKASAFTTAFQEVVATTPYLDANNERPLDSAAANATTEIADRARDSLLRALARTVGLGFFFRSDCAICAQEVAVLDAARRLYGLTVLAVSLDGKPLRDVTLASWVPDVGQARRMGVVDGPALVLMRPPSEFLGLSQSVLSLAELGERTLLRAQAAGWISQAEYAATRPVKEQSMIALSREITPAMLEDPEALSKFIHARLEGAP